MFLSFKSQILRKIVSQTIKFQDLKENQNIHLSFPFLTTSPNLLHELLKGLHDLWKAVVKPLFYLFQKPIGRSG